METEASLNSHVVIDLKYFLTSFTHNLKSLNYVAF